MQYILEVYLPGSTDDVWMTFQSAAPFAAIQAGDLLNPGIWPNSEAPKKVLRVIRVEHVIWQAPETLNHKVMLFTEEEPGNRAARLP